MNTEMKNISFDKLMSRVRGKIQFNAPMAKFTWFRTGGNADILFTPEDEEDLCFFLKTCPPDLPVMPLGVGSNLLIRDGGIEGVVIRLGKKFSQITIQGDTVTAGAGAPDISVANAALKNGLSGLEFLRGVPGTIGGALKMNAGAYGNEVKDIFKSATAVDRSGKIYFLATHDMHFSYRHSEVPEDFIFINATLIGRSKEKIKIKKRMDEIRENREKSQPLRQRTGGSTFKNPVGKSAWKLIEDAGCRGLTIGNVKVSEKHCNFLINVGGVNSQNIEDLGEEVRRRVMNNSGVKLEWEIKRVGRKI